MFRSPLRTLLIGLLVLSLAAGCTLSPRQQSATAKPAPLSTQTAAQPPTTPPTLPPPPTETAAPTRIPAPAQITPQNGGGLAVARQLSLGAAPFQIKWSQDSATLGFQLPDGLTLLNAADLSVKATVVITDPVMLLDYSTEGEWMATTADRTRVDVRDITTGAVAATLEPSSVYMSASFSPDGRTLAIPSDNIWAVELWNIAEARLVQTYTGFETAAPVYSAKISSNGQYLIWWARAGVQLTPLAGGASGPRLSHEDFVGGLELSPDGTTLAAATSGTLDGELMPFIQLWDPMSGEDLGRLKTGPQVAYSLSFSPDGSLLAASTANNILLWDVAAQEQVAALTGSGGRVNAVSFSPDGTTLAAATEDGTVTLWQILP